MRALHWRKQAFAAAWFAGRMQIAYNLRWKDIAAILQLGGLATQEVHTVHDTNINVRIPPMARPQPRISLQEA